MRQTYSFTTLLTVAFVFLLGGLIIAGCLNMTPSSTAQTPAAPAAASAPPAAGAPDAAAGPTITLPDFSVLAKRLNPAVVNISTTKVVKSPFAMRQGPFGHGGPGGPGQGDPFEDFFNRFFQGQPQREFKQRSLGSGFIIDKAGYILTNNHVVDAADEIIVTLGDEREVKAKVIGKDEKTDISLIKIEDASDLPVAPLGDSDQLQIGEWIMAIGNPFGLSHTVTAGIVSAKARQIGAGPYDDFIQVDASINPGNSGGPLINSRGLVVGINTAIFSNTGQSAGIGFAIPINLAKNIAEQLRTKGKVTRGWLGVLIQRIDPDLQKSYGLKDAEGALVSKVIPDSPAAKAGIQQGDVIVKFNDKPITHHSDLPVLVANVPPGKSVKLDIIRGGKAKSVEVMISELKDGAEKAAPDESEDDGAGGRFGLQLQDIPAPMAHELGIKGGVVVAQVEPGGIAEQKGMQAGDIILELNGKKIDSAAAFVKDLKGIKSGDVVRLLVRREDNQYFVALPKP
jgi:serine protease Do